MKPANTHTNFQRVKVIKISFFLAVFIGFICLLFAVDNLLLSFLLAIVTNYMLRPIIDFLKHCGLNRNSSTTLVFAALTVLIAGLFYSFLPLISIQFTKLNLELPRYIAGITHFLVDVETFLESITGSLFDINLSSHVENLMTTWTSSLFEDLTTLISHAVTIVFLAPFLAFFIIKDGPNLSQKILSFVPNDIFELCLSLEHQINKQMGQFVRARILEAVFVGVIVWIGLSIIELPFAGLLALFAGLVNLVPYIGPLVGPIPGLIVALINEYEPSFFVAIIIIYGIAQILDILFIIPLVVARIVNLHPITVVLAIIIGAQTMGVLGMIISIPVVSTIKVVFLSLNNHMFYFHK